MAETGGLRLLADDAEGLSLMAAAVQDALVRPQDMAFHRRARSCGLEVCRFQWERAGRRPPYFRSRAILALSGVLNVRSQALPRGVDDVLSLLDVRFHPGAEAPAGEVELAFAGGGRLMVQVECLEATLHDTGPVWPTRKKPDHGTRP